MAKPRVFLEVAINGESIGRLVVELHADIVPKTAENFRCLCTGEKGRGESKKRLNFLGSKIHRVVPGLGIVGGDITMGNGTGGESIYGFTFPDENFEVKHDAPGIVTMANSGPDTNGSQFLILKEAAPQLDGKNVAFGKVVEGLEALAKIEECVDEEGELTKTVKVEFCGEADAPPSSAADEGAAAEGEGGQGASKRQRREKDNEVVTVRHILRKHSGLKKPTSWRQEKITCSQEEAAKYVAGLRKRLRGLKGPNLEKRFEALAREESDCKSAKKGGDLGPFERDMMQKAFEKAAFALNVGELSDVVSTKLGEHLILRTA
eukprot:TRINITY_DN55950_c0_g1_i1.p2 TRINITY_DN55950_c0_g1~~TRINITY_DN55950_c0_g1_i1.p2  ORF type:complete len:320 (-),score=97.05 TRINITY_DN55950_c0_g1_i1:60-1019(-)